MTDQPPEDGPLTGELGEVFRRVAEQDEVLRGVIARVSAARKRYKSDRSDEAQRNLDKVELELVQEHKKFSELAGRAEALSGIPAEILEALEDDAIAGDEAPRFKRVEVAGVDPTDWVETYLPRALETLLPNVKAAWIEEQRQSQAWRLGREFLESPLSLVRGIRSESEYPAMHRFAQALLVSQDYLEGRPDYDFFAGAMLAPQTAALGTRLPSLGAASGDVQQRIDSLWLGGSESVDSTVFELLVGSGCLEKGRQVEFLPTTSETSPDLRIHDYTLPTVVECKRKRPLSVYELEEESAIREVFHALRDRVRKAGTWGLYQLELTIEVANATIRDIVDCCIRQRLSPHPAEPIKYAWGSIAYRELPARFDIPRCRLYSPRFLRGVFGWDTDLPGHDGIVCQVGSPADIVIDRLRDPIALVWKSTSAEAIKRRSWTPASHFGDATQQIPGGDVGVLYVCYREGARAEVADRRTERLAAQLHDWVHDPMVRIPIAFAVRLYARPLGDGNPDLIESTMRFFSKAYGNEAMFADFPSVVFTKM